ncbi:hypothetical protein DPMN_115774 [Dreissena polymorpha]|uniref:Uncharacterized protein n=1 Tax=Dreissena polymorpha TaxID=45954 RepID=A0A9D4KN33_DREPO|nr:hypothetical protein DPMN_115774 [Dreissena polymorpha]
MEDSRQPFKRKGTTHYGRRQREVPLESCEGHDGWEEKQQGRSHTDKAAGSTEVQRPSKLAEGVYVHGKVNGHPLTFTAITDASRAIISTRAFNQLPGTSRPQLDQSVRLVVANGAPIKDAGEAIMQLELCPVTLSEQVIIAEIEDEALLGTTFLRKDTENQQISC